MSYPYHFRTAGVWIGLVRLSGNYHWIDGTELVRDDNTNDTKCMSYGRVSLQDNPIYISDSCVEEKHFVCENSAPPGEYKYFFVYILHHKSSREKEKE